MATREAGEDLADNDHWLLPVHKDDDDSDDGQKDWLSDDLDDSIETDFAEPDYEGYQDIFMEHEDDELSSLEDEEDADDLTEDDFRDEGLTDIDSDDDSVGCEDLMDVDECGQDE
ncbi:hypothetical protein MAA_10664 [Metarhizium robertsii ARSEF 23]|uniref:Uncharacterized protein n=1 Tax=Metarhizium robertsii (strain ARSEF 23 / ATCC MYA-3075) TaxID=655844 RepID=A0A0B2XG94_METRA|nr:uncharacterized protein MAA_10664 [Metarhizium robertsii ARSEF 23]KHO11720.1 hypothetical protein MAA_10664 [Metarhizium robertsii ARSEF 23]